MDSMSLWLEVILWLNTIDTFKTFKEVFKDKLDISIDDKIKLWEYEYMIHYP